MTLQCIKSSKFLLLKKVDKSANLSDQQHCAVNFAFLGKGRQDENLCSMEFFEDTLGDIIHNLGTNEGSLINWTEMILEGMRGQWTKTHSAVLVNLLYSSYSKLAQNCAANISIRRFIRTRDVQLLLKHNGENVFYLGLVNFMLADTADQQISSLFAVHMVEDAGELIQSMA